MKLKKAVGFFLSVGLALVSQGIQAEIIPRVFNWLGSNGYSVQGHFSYDNSVSTPIIGNGLGDTQGLEYLNVSFYDSDKKLLFSTVDVAGGQSVYGDLIFIYDSLAGAFQNNFSFNMGENSQTGDLVLGGIIGESSSILNFDSEQLSGIDWDTTITIPEPSSLSLALPGLAFLVARPKRKA